MFPILRLKPGKERATNNRHPWIFSGAVDSVSEGATNGDIVRIERADKTMVGFGFYNPKAMIQCRVFEFTDTGLDGEVNEQYWKNKISRAWEIRQNYILETTKGSTTACRIIHAEGDLFPGIIADLYHNVLVVDVLIEGTKRLLPTLEKLFLEVLPIERVVARVKEKIPKKQTTTTSSDEKNFETTADLVQFEEHDLVYEADISSGQKTGFFLDQRDSRLLIRNYTANKKVLNTFSYSGGFSLNALAAGASLVHSVDISGKALAEAERNLTLNAEALAAVSDRHQIIKADCFKFLAEIEQDAYDLIVLDPPAFTKHKKTVPQASRGYKELNLKAFKKIASGGILFTYSCSQHIDRDLFRKIVFSAAADAGRNVRILHQVGHAIDHPINIYHPENEYLKGLVLMID